jgi:hypothetical protein
MTASILIAHDIGDQTSVDVIAEAVRAAGYEVAHNGTVMVGESFTEEASKVLSNGGAVIVCATVRALGRGWIHHLTYAARANRAGRIRVFCLQMERDAYIRQIAADDAVAAYWQDPHEAIGQLVSSLKKHFPLALPGTAQSNEPSRDNLHYLDQLTAVADFDGDAIVSFRQQLREDVERRLPGHLTNDQFLSTAQVMVNGLLTRSGQLLFGKNPPIAYAVKCIFYKGTTKASERDPLDIDGTVPHQIIETRNFIAKRIKKREYPSSDRPEAIVRYQYPMICVRELIANALVHRDYIDSQRHVSVRVFEDRIEILSPGAWFSNKLSGGDEVPLSMLQSESIQRNPTLAHILSWIKYVELEGSGIPTGLEDCKATNSPIPTVVEEEGFVRVTIRPCIDWDSEYEHGALLSDEQFDRVVSIFRNNNERRWKSNWSSVVRDDS